MKTATAVLGAACLLALCGCRAPNSYTSGTSTAIGAYVPYDGQLFGAEIVSYLNGCRVQCASNRTMKIEREFAATNSYFGIVHTVESVKEKVDVR